MASGFRSKLWLSAILPVLLCEPAMAGPKGDTTLSVIMFFRHGIRAPLDGELPRGADAKIWPHWDTQPGHLTSRGYRNAHAMGEWLAGQWRQEGLLPKGCPNHRLIAIRSNFVPRTIDTARAIAEGVAPGCRIAVQHNPDGVSDPIFDPIGAGAMKVDVDAVGTSLPRDSTALLSNYPLPLAKLREVYGCGPTDPACGIEALPKGPVKVDAKGVHPDERTRAYAGAAQGLLLQYAEGLPMQRIAGRQLDSADVALLSPLHALPFILEARLPAMASGLARPFLEKVLEQFAPGSTTQPMRLFIGHDNVVSAITARLGIDFKADGYGLNDPPLGGGIGFELIRLKGRGLRVRTFLVAQSPDQLRRVSVLKGDDQPRKEYFALNGCSKDASFGCSIADFHTLLAAALAAVRDIRRGADVTKLSQ